MAGKRYLREVDFVGIATAVAAVVVAGTLVVAALAKLRDPAGAVAGARGLGAGRWSGFVGAALPGVEMFAGILLLVPRTRRLGGVLALLLLLLFSLAIARALRNGRHPQCHCFGRRSAPVSNDTLVRNAALAAIALVVAVAP